MVLEEITYDYRFREPPPDMCMPSSYPKEFFQAQEFFPFIIYMDCVWLKDMIEVYGLP